MSRTIVTLMTLLALGLPATSLAAPPAGGTQTPNTTSTTAQLTAFVFSDDGQVTYHFEYGPTTAYGAVTPDRTTATPGSGTQVTEPISGLTPSTTYHVRVVMTNTSGATDGGDITFTTRAPEGAADSDGDGVPNSTDACPSQQGPAANNGCPVQGPSQTDTDGDGLPDFGDDCPTVAGTQQYKGCRDTDGDTLADNRDACPTVAGPQTAAGCPDEDRDGFPDAGDACPKAYGQPGSKGCPDSDEDGLTNDVDPCPKEGKDPRYPKRKVKADGCYPTFVQVGFYPGTVKGLSDDNKGTLEADCDFNHKLPCSIHVTVTLSKKSAKAAGVKERQIADIKIPLTTKAQKEAAHPCYATCGGPPKQGKLNLGIPAALSKKLAKLKVVTLTLRGAYKLGSAGPVSLGSRDYKLGRRAPEDSGNSTNPNRLANIPGFDDVKVATGPGENEDDERR